MFGQNPLEGKLLQKQKKRKALSQQEYSWLYNYILNE